jgi:hypothetical protein
MTLRIEIDQQGFLSGHGQAMREGDSGGSLAYAAFLIGNREYSHRCFPYKNTNGRRWEASNHSRATESANADLNPCFLLCVLTAI